MTLAAVIELIHLATLVHDDSVDHSALRRGMPTINAIFSHQTAVIMGDYLYSRAIIELVRAFKKIPDLINRLDEYYPPRGAAPPPPPLPDIAIIEQKNWWGYALAGAVGAAIAAGLFLIF